MFDRPTSSHSLGIVHDGSVVLAAALSWAKGKPKCDRLYTLPLTFVKPKGNVNLFDTIEEGKELRSSLNKHLSVSILDSQYVLTRQLEIKLKKEKEIDEVLAFQAEPLIPFPIENAVLDRMTLATTAEGTKLVLLAAKKEQVQKHIEEWEEFEIEPEVVSCEPAALAFFSQTFAPSAEPRLLVHVGNSHTTCLLVKEGKPLAVQTSSLGTDAFLDALKHDDIEANLIEIDMASIEPRHLPFLAELTARWLQEVTRILYSLSKQSKEQEVSELIFTGDGADLKNLDNLLNQQLNKKLISLEVYPEFGAAVEEIRRFAVPIGAALGGLPMKYEQVNFRQNEFDYPHPWKRLKYPLALYFGACLLLTAAILLFTQVYLGYKENSLRENYIVLLHSVNKTFPSFEKEYAKKSTGSQPPSASVNDLNADQIAARIEALRKELQASPEMFPLLPHIPRVSDLLAWLSTHAKMKSEEGSLQIQSLNYSLVKRPEIKKKQEKYQVKVEMEFSSPTPKQAREFHDALIAPNEMVDPKGEVKWSSNRGLYRASFFLKDKTAYVGN